MDDFEYSFSALSVLNLFHDSDFMVYVEGEDDIVFWENILNIADIKGYYLQSVNGADNLEPIIRNIIDNGAKVIVAKDQDHNRFMDCDTNHVQIVTTFGYSIENTMYCPSVVNDIIKSLSKTTTDNTEIIENWYEDFYNACHKLLSYDIANNRSLKSISIFGDNCCRFLINSKSPKLSENKIEHHIESIQDHFSHDEIEICNTMINEFAGKKRYLIKGHFITHALINFIKLIVYKISNKTVIMPSDNLYALTINGCKYCRQICDEIHNTIFKIKLAYQAITVIA